MGVLVGSGCAGVGSPGEEVRRWGLEGNDADVGKGEERRYKGVSRERELFING